MLEYIEKVECDGLPQLDASRDLQVIILRSISLADHRQSQNFQALSYPTEIVFQSYNAAVDSLKHMLLKPTTTLGIQAAISVQLFLVSMLRLNAASRLGGLINRMALQLRLHRCPARYSSFTVDEKQIRNRVFWSLYAIDRFVCQSMGLPLGITDDDVDVCFPNSEQHGDVQQRRQIGTGSSQSSSAIFKSVIDVRLKVLEFVARQSKLRGKIIELRNKSRHYVQKERLSQLSSRSGGTTSKGIVIRRAEVCLHIKQLSSPC